MTQTNAAKSARNNIALPNAKANNAACAAPMSSVPVIVRGTIAANPARLMNAPPTATHTNADMNARLNAVLHFAMGRIVVLNAPEIIAPTSAKVIIVASIAASNQPSTIYKTVQPRVALKNALVKTVASIVGAHIVLKIARAEVVVRRAPGGIAHLDAMRRNAASFVKTTIARKDAQTIFVASIAKEQNAHLAAKEPIAANFATEPGAPPTALALVAVLGAPAPTAPLAAMAWTEIAAPPPPLPPPPQSPPPPPSLRRCFSASTPPSPTTATTRTGSTIITISIAMNPRCHGVRKSATTNRPARPLTRGTKRARYKFETPRRLFIMTYCLVALMLRTGRKIQLEPRYRIL